MDATASRSEFRIGFVSTAGVGGHTRDRRPNIPCALLRKPAKGPDFNGMYSDLSTEPRLSW